MRLVPRAWSLPAAMLGCCLLAGCGRNTSNEEGFIKPASEPAPTVETPQFKGYGDAMQYQADQAKKQAAETKTKKKGRR